MSDFVHAVGALDVPSPAAAAALPRAGRAANPRILLAATLRWPLAARLAIALRRLGCEVHAWCPPGHPLHRTQAVARVHAGGDLPPRSLRAALDAAAPDFVIPCDDGAALDLCRLADHAAGAPPHVRALIERSLGKPASCALATDRGELMRVALAHGVRVPAGERIAGEPDLFAWALRHSFPAVLKVDGTWGGLGVSIVHNHDQACAAFARAVHPPLRAALADLLLRRDGAALRRRFARARPNISMQAFVAGRTANRAVACWRGEVLAGISVVALQTQTPTGPASVVRVIDHPEMAEASRRLVRALGLSGLCGLDFVLEAATGAAVLIEMNPRATPISHLALGAGRDLPAALHACLRGDPAPLPGAAAGAAADEIIAMFPGEWRRNPQSPYLHTAHHDVPWDEAELVRDCIEGPWEDRGLLARLRALVAPGRGRRPAPEIRLARGASPEG